MTVAVSSLNGALGGITRPERLRGPSAGDPRGRRRSRHGTRGGDRAPITGAELRVLSRSHEGCFRSNYRTRSGRRDGGRKPIDGGTSIAQ